MYRLIINPAAGIWKGKKTGEAVMAFLKERNIPFDVRYTEVGTTSDLSKEAVKDGIDTVIAIGGDGTISEAAKGLLYTRTSLGIIACGTGNDFIKAAGIPKEWREALNLILTRPAVLIDSCLMNERFFLNLAGGGFDILTLEYANHAKKFVKGLLPYLFGVICAIFAYRPFDMTIRVDGKDISQKALICAIGNGTHFGGGMPMIPMAKIDDGKLDIMIVDGVNKMTVVRKLHTLLNGTLHQLPISHHYLGEDVFLSYPNMKLELDGEIISVDSAHFRLQKRSILLHKQSTL